MPNENDYSFWGIDETDTDPMWDVLHEHFKKLEKDDPENVKKPAKRKK